MRVAIITETFAPDLNGVAHSVLRAAEHLTARGHDVVVIAPEPLDAVSPTYDYPVVRVSSLPMVGYPTFRIGLPSRRVGETLGRFAPDVVHLAAPFAFGAHGLATAMRMGLPTVAVYQTDVPRFAAGYGLGFAEEAVVSRVSALAEVFGTTGEAVHGDGVALADALQRIASRPRTDRELIARAERSGSTGPPPSKASCAPTARGYASRW